MPEIHFTVCGRGEFPRDMLRYDSAEFATAEDRTVALECERQRRSVALICRAHEARYCRPTVVRWESFGWAVVAADSGRVSRHVTPMAPARSPVLAQARAPLSGADAVARLSAALTLLKDVRAAAAGDMPRDLLERIEALVGNDLSTAASAQERS